MLARAAASLVNAQRLKRAVEFWRFRLWADFGLALKSTFFDMGK